MKNIIYILITFLFFSNCTPSEEEMKEVYNEFFVEGFELNDTLINFSLDSNSLILEFAPPTKFKSWTMEVYLVNKKTKDQIKISSTNETKIISNRIAYRNFKIPINQIDNYYPVVFACPNPIDTNYIFISVPPDAVKNKYSQKDTTKKSLQCWQPNRKYVMLNFHLLADMDDETREYCLQKFEKFMETSEKLPNDIKRIK